MPCSQQFNSTQTHILQHVIFTPLHLASTFGMNQMWNIFDWQNVDWFSVFAISGKKKSNLTCLLKIYAWNSFGTNHNYFFSFWMTQVTWSRMQLWKINCWCILFEFSPKMWRYFKWFLFCNWKIIKLFNKFVIEITLIETRTSLSNQVNLVLSLEKGKLLWKINKQSEKALSHNDCGRDCDCEQNRIRRVVIGYTCVNASIARLI